jgi:hypothetical protein
MRPVADLLREALRDADEQGRVQVNGGHLTDDAMADLVAQTYRYALEHADESSDGWLVFRGGIASWWCQEADLPIGDFDRLYKLRTDVVKRLTDQRLAYRRSPRSVPLYVRRG